MDDRCKATDPVEADTRLSGVHRQLWIHHVKDRRNLANFPSTITVAGRSLNPFSAHIYKSNLEKKNIKTAF